MTSTSPYFEILTPEPPDGTVQIIVTRGDGFIPIAACHAEWGATIRQALNGHGGPFPDHP